MRILLGLLLFCIPLNGNAQMFVSGDIVFLQHAIVCNEREDGIKLLTILQFPGEETSRALRRHVENERDESGEFRCTFIRKPARFRIGEKVYEADTPSLENPNARMTWYLISVSPMGQAKIQYFLSIIPVQEKRGLPIQTEHEI